MTKRSRFALLLRFIIGLALAAVLAAAMAPFFGVDVRQLLGRSIGSADYSWLRRELAAASRTADAALQGVRSNGTRAGAGAAALALERAIVYSRASARRTGTQAIPDDIRRQLEDFFPDDLLDEVRWAFPNSDLDLGSAAAWYQRDGGAITLQDTIVYSTRHAAQNRYLWAHELTHALQYEELGLRGFARVYVTDPQLLERQAWDNAKRIVAELQAREARAASVARAEGREAGLEPAE